MGPHSCCDQKERLVVWTHLFSLTFKIDVNTKKKNGLFLGLNRIMEQQETLCRWEKDQT